MASQQFEPSLKALGVAEVLNEIVEHNSEQVAAGVSTGMVDARITVCSQTLVGFPLKIDPRNNVVITTKGGLAYVSAEDIVMVEVIDTSLIIDRLADSEPGVGTSQPPSSAVVPPASPPRSELREAVRQLNASLNSKFAMSLEADVLSNPSLTDLGKNQFVPFLDMIEESFDSFAADDVGEITLRSVDRVGVVLGDTLDLKRSGGAMVIVAPLNTDLPPSLRTKFDTMLAANL